VKLHVPSTTLKVFVNNSFHNCLLLLNPSKYMSIGNLYRVFAPYTPTTDPKQWQEATLMNVIAALSRQ
jgi:hypothetical protein